MRKLPSAPQAEIRRSTDIADSVLKVAARPRQYSVQKDGAAGKVLAAGGRAVLRDIVDFDGDTAQTFCRPMTRRDAQMGADVRLINPGTAPTYIIQPVTSLSRQTLPNSREGHVRDAGGTGRS